MAARELAHLWPLLFPATYALHLAEEYWGGDGFAHWLAQVLGGNISASEFLLINGIAWPLMLLASLLSIRSERLAWIWVSLATIVLVNAALHLCSSLWTRTYSPGVLTGIALYAPLGAFGLRRGYERLARRQFWKAAVIGLLIHAVVVAVAFG